MPHAERPAYGTFSEQRVQQLADNDWRKTHANFTGENLPAMSPGRAMRPIADKHATTVGCVAVAWTLAVPGVTAAIFGARQPAQVDSMVGRPGLSSTTRT